MIERLLAAAAGAPLLLDAAMGTRLIARGLRLERDDPVFWNVSHPDAVSEIHQSDIAAGSRALLTNSFGANRAWLARFDRPPPLGKILGAAVTLARRQAGPERLVVGSIGPTAWQDPAALLEQAASLAEHGVDALLFETYRLHQAEAALRVVGGNVTLPLWVSLVAWPEPLAESVRRLSDLGAVVLGANCQPGLEPMIRLAKELRQLTPGPLLLKPSAGAPGQPSLSPQSFAAAVPALRELGPILIGGCCGTTEAHVAALDAACYDVPSGNLYTA